MFIIDGVYRNVDISGLSAPILEGTVLTETGAIASADGSDAFGIVPQNIYEIPPTKLASVVVGGTIDLLSPANANVEFSEAVMKALGTDINFVQNSEAANEVPKPTSADAGKVVTVNQDGDGYVLGEGGGGGKGIQIIRLLKIKDLPPVPDGWTPIDSYNMQNLESDAPVLFSPDVITYALVENSNTNIMLKPSFIHRIIIAGGENTDECAPCVVAGQAPPYTPANDSGQNDQCWITGNVLQLTIVDLGASETFAAIDTSSLRWVRAVIQ